MTETEDVHARETDSSNGVEAGRESRNGHGNRNGRLIVLTGPTAVGKGTVEAELRAHHPEVWVSVSATTRAPRPGEVNGRNYWFMSEGDFLSKEANGWFLETAIVHNMAHYGTPLQPVLDHIAQNTPTILEIDLQGARRVKSKAAGMGLDVVYVFIAPPSYDELVRRLVGRGTENEEQRKKRLETAKLELASEGEFDVTIVNNSIEQCAEDLWAIIAKEYGLER
ncbi:guanylate kinase [Bifidobacterium sp.]|jgi:guanylate kinase|uniref:guanylate kinase n=1 Tax=Bifidobacterium sp. TaxID=41200 RepID=UPI0025C1EB66|nr:guanylate kinase [Bifidobacterium sp.]MCH4208721.1 guanylate kinase [Bifidobacterium sp.]MCI1224307.1 guanylate kinase [Bifidobacterium sp.]